MFDTMKFENGVGLAAPQIGVLKRLVVVESKIQKGILAHLTLKKKF